MSKYADESRHDDGKPNPIVNAASDAAAALRADKDQLELAKCYDSLGPKAIEKLTAQEARMQPTAADAVKAMLAEQGRSSEPQALVPGVGSADVSVRGAQGPLPARIYTPLGATRPLPLIVYFHGGGWVIADKDVYDSSARELSSQCGAIVVSVDYRRAPEHKFPAAWDDALSAYRWCLENAQDLGADPRRVAIAGESAGGNLAVATAMAARDMGMPLPCHVLAVYPVAGTSLNTESYMENAIAKPLNRAIMKWFFDQVVRSDDDLKDPRLDLIHADLHGLPSVTIIGAALDPLRSDGAKLEDTLNAAGVQVRRRTYDGVAHEFFGGWPVLHKAQEAQAFASERLRNAFAGG